MVNPRPGLNKRRSMNATLTKNKKILEEDYEEDTDAEVDSEQAQQNSVAVSGERLYNVGNFESVRIRVEYKVSVDSNTEARQMVRRLSKRIPDDIEEAFDVFCDKHQLRRKKE